MTTLAYILSALFPLDYLGCYALYFEYRQNYFHGIIRFCRRGGWSGGAMVLGKLPVPGRPTIWISVGQGPTALAVGAGGVVWTFLHSSILSLLFLPLFGRRPDID